MTDQELMQAHRITEKSGPGIQPSALSGTCPLPAAVLVLGGDTMCPEIRRRNSDYTEALQKALGIGAARNQRKWERDQLATPEPRSWTERGRASTSGWRRRCSCWYPGSDPCVMEEALFLSRWNWSPWWPLTVFSVSASSGASFVRPTIRKQRWRWAVSHSMEQPQFCSHGPRAQNTQNWWRGEWLEYICLHQGFLPGLRRLSIVQWEDVVQ